MPHVQVTPAAPGERPILENLMQFYVHDFSEHWHGMARGELGEDGRFEAYPLDPYWSDPGHIPLIIRADGFLAGFALLNAESHSGRPVDRNMAEFFVVRKHRRSGVGLTAARIIFGLYPGLWEAAVARRNLAALPFWRKAAGEFEELDLADERWNGPVLRFRAGGEATTGLDAV